MKKSLIVQVLQKLYLNSRKNVQNVKENQNKQNSRKYFFNSNKKKKLNNNKNLVKAKKFLLKFKKRHKEKTLCYKPCNLEIDSLVKQEKKVKRNSKINENK